MVLSLNKSNISIHPTSMWYSRMEIKIVFDIIDNAEKIPKSIFKLQHIYQNYVLILRFIWIGIIHIILFNMNNEDCLYKIEFRLISPSTWKSKKRNIFVTVNIMGNDWNAKTVVAVLFSCIFPGFVGTVESITTNINSHFKNTKCR